MELAKVIRLATITLIVGGIAWWGKAKVDSRTVSGSFATYAYFRDGSRLPIGSKVLVAGIQVGRIEKLSIEGSLSRVDMALTPGVALYSDAVAHKRTSSALGDNYLEIFPGGPDLDGVMPEGVHKLRSGEPVSRVVEAASPEKMLRSIDDGLPLIDQRLAAMNDTLRVGRTLIQGPVTGKLGEFEAYLNRGAWDGAIVSAATGATKFDQWTDEVARGTAGMADTVLPKLDKFNGSLVQLTRDMQAGRVTITTSLGEFRTKLDQVDPYLEKAGRVVGGLNGERGDAEQGVLGKLINNGDLGENLDDGARAMAKGIGSVTKMQVLLGLRGEIDMRSTLSRQYITLEFGPRNGYFYAFEALSGSYGATPVATLTNDGTGTRWVEKAEIENGLRFSAQWGKRFRWFSYRVGIKESQLGVGIDGDFFRSRLKLSADATLHDYKAGFRGRFSAAFEIYRNLYFWAGVDDAFNPPSSLTIAPYPGGREAHPGALDRVYFGRDVFFGLSVVFRDEDLRTFLPLYGGVATGFL